MSALTTLHMSSGTNTSSMRQPKGRLPMLVVFMCEFLAAHSKNWIDIWQGELLFASVELYSFHTAMVRVGSHHLSSTPAFQPTKCFLLSIRRYCME